MNWIKNALLVTFSLCFSLTVAEIYLMIDGRYQDQVNLQIKEVNTNKIWSREINSQDTRKHPDLNYDIDIIFDEIGARKSSYDWKEKAPLVGVFGDSFTENRRIENEYTFTEILNSVSDTNHFINFGVDGYGLEQSFQHWIDKKLLVKMDIVFYVFCANDFENTYEVQLFDRKKMAENIIMNKAIMDIPIYVRLASKFHLTYLFIESYYNFKSIIISPDELIDQLARRFSPANVDFRNRQFDPYVSSLTKNLIEDNLDLSTSEALNHFKATLNAWNRRVLDQNGEFIVLILPREEENIISSKLIPKNIKAINLGSYENSVLMKDISWDFNSDGHWNEYGNLTAAMSLYSLLREMDLIKKSNKEVDKSIWENFHTKIDRLYNEKSSG